jgi:hypothetical protein
VDVIAAIEELLGQYPAPTHLRMDNGLSSLPMHCKSGVREMDRERNTFPQVHLGRIHSWSHSTAG